MTSPLTETQIIQNYNQAVQNLTPLSIPGSIIINQGTSAPVTVSGMTQAMAAALGYNLGTDENYEFSWDNTADEFAPLVDYLNGNNNLSIATNSPNSVTPGPPPLPSAAVSTWNQFVTDAISNFTNAQGQVVQDNQAGLLAAFSAQYAATSGLNNISPPFTTAQIQSQFEAAFANFLQNYPGPSPVTADSFFQNWLQYSSSPITINQGTSTSPPSLSYQQIYFSQNPLPPASTLTLPVLTLPDITSSAYDITDLSGNVINAAEAWQNGQSATSIWESENNNVAPPNLLSLSYSNTQFNNALSAYQTAVAAGQNPDPNSSAYNVSIPLYLIEDDGGSIPVNPATHQYILPAGFTIDNNGNVVFSAAAVYNAGYTTDLTALQHYLNVPIDAYVQYQNYVTAFDNARNAYLNAYTTANNNYNAAVIAYNTTYLQPPTIPAAPTPPTVSQPNPNQYNVDFSSVSGGTGGTVSLSTIQGWLQATSGLSSAQIADLQALGYVYRNPRQAGQTEFTGSGGDTSVSGFNQSVYNAYVSATNQYNSALTTYNTAEAAYQTALTNYNAIVTNYDRLVALDATDPAFQKAVAAYANQQISTNGYFIPAQSAAGFSNYLSGIGQIFPDKTTLAPMNAQKALILNQIFALASSFVGVLQSVAASQANVLNLYTKVQQAYTDKINQIHVFLVGDTSVDSNISKADSGSSTTNQDYRSELNTANSSYQQAATANQQITSDQAKALESNINQTNDAVTQQTDLVTAIIQELSTILSTMFSNS